MSLQSGKNAVIFKSFRVQLAGDLYLPENFDANKKYKTIVGTMRFLKDSYGEIKLDDKIIPTNATIPDHL